MKCPNCNNEIAPDSDQCQNCLNKLNVAHPQIPSKNKNTNSKTSNFNYISTDMHIYFYIIGIIYIVVSLIFFWGNENLSRDASRIGTSLSIIVFILLIFAGKVLSVLDSIAQMINIIKNQKSDSK